MVCNEVEVEVPKKLIKQATVQHLYGRLNGVLHSDAQEASAPHDSSLSTRGSPLHYGVITVTVIFCVITTVMTVNP
jgi:hypothetical protein